MLLACGAGSQVRKMSRFPSFKTLQTLPCFFSTSKILQPCSRADSKQRKLLEENYGKHDEEKVSKVKELFAGLQLEAAFKTYEEESYAEIQVIRNHSFPFPCLHCAMKGLIKLFVSS